MARLWLGGGQDDLFPIRPEGRASRPRSRAVDSVAKFTVRVAVQQLVQLAWVHALDLPLDLSIVVSVVRVVTRMLLAAVLAHERTNLTLEALATLTHSHIIVDGSRVA
jgi:hypothetical protein